MRRDPKLVRMLRDATREAAQDLENLKIVKPEDHPGVAVLRYELRKSLATNDRSLAKQARSVSRQAKQSAAHHRLELMEMKRVAREAAAELGRVKARRGLGHRQS